MPSLTKETQIAPSPLPPPRGQSVKTAQEVGPHHHRIVGRPNPCQLWEINICSLRHLTHGIFVLIAQTDKDTKLHFVWVHKLATKLGKNQNPLEKKEEEISKNHKTE